MKPFRFSYLPALFREVGFTLFWLLFILLCGEFVTRSTIFQQITPFPSSGSLNTEIDLKFKLLTTYVREQGYVDCIFIGSSSTDHALDPEIFVNAYQKRTGFKPKCFNFGIQGLRISIGRKLAQILMQDYHPRLILFGTNHKEFYVTAISSEYVPWLDYRLGSWSLDGWLLGNFYAFRYLRTFYSYADGETRGARNTIQLTSLGYYPDSKVASPPNVALNSSPSFPKYFINADETENFQKLLEVPRVMFFEEPTHPAYLPYLIRGGENGYEQIYVAALQQPAEAKGLVFLRTRQMFSQISLAGWKDNLHTNSTGAALFSEWLGAYVAELRLLSPALR